MTKIFAHRGSTGTHPENTMAAFIEAYEVGADGIELDINYTKDKQLAVIHDATIDRTTNGSGKVRDFTLKELKELSAGAWFSPEYTAERIPILTEVLEWIQDKDLELNIEIKYATLDFAEYEEKVLAQVEAFGLEDRTIISSFHHGGLKRIRELNPSIECGILYLERLYEPWHYVRTVGATALHSIWTATDEAMVTEASKHASPVRVYTVNKKKHLKHFLELGCSAIITDYPERAIKMREDLPK